MRKQILRLAEFLLKILAKLTLKRFKPRIIGVTGNAGKTSTKQAIYTVLKHGTDLRVRVSGGSLNTEIGFPLSILGDYRESGGLLFGIGVIAKGLLQLVSPFARRNYPEILILEYGTEKPGDIEKLINICRPDIGVVTVIGSVPVHIEFYESVDAVVEEKSCLIKDLGPAGKAVLNIDDPRVFGMREIANTEVITFGFDSSADVRITEFKNKSKDGKPFGMMIKLGVLKNNATVEIDGVFGRSQAYAVAAATAVGLAERINLTKIVDTLALYEGVKGRVKLIPGIKGSFILDDSYNSSPLSAAAALEILDDLDAKRKVAVIGDMLELGVHTEGAHRDLGRHAARVVDYLVTVGARAEFIAEGALERGFPENKIGRFDTSDSAKTAVQELIKEGDLVLVKGSQGIRMEKIVLEIMAEPQRAKELLVRQYGKWLKG